jgi:2-polyprenyl-6-methoxyphenol hydroxylase-like FAD-dependent oxidoreductase
MKVVIVGAGPAGAALALLLARYGVAVTLYERETSSERVFRGEGLLPLGVDALCEMGLADVLAALPSRRIVSWNIFIEGQEVFVIPEPAEELGERAARVVSQPALLEALIEAAQAYPTFRLERGVRVHDLRYDDGRVTGVRVATSEREGELREVDADLVVGCDGRGSLVRTRAGLGLELLPEQYGVLWFKLPAPELLRETCKFMLMVRGGAHPALCYTSWDGGLQYGLILPKGGSSGLRDEGWLPLATASAPDWLARHVLEQREQIQGPMRLNVLVGRCPKWTRPGLLLLGDAAHPMSPVRAQGVNLALRDALVAANQLVPVLSRGGDQQALDAAAAAVQSERQPEIIRAQALQRREAAGQGDARSASWRFTLAKRIAPVLGRYRWAQRAWLQRQHDLRFGSVEVKLRLPAAAPPNPRGHEGP